MIERHSKMKREEQKTQAAEALKREQEALKDKQAYLVPVRVLEQLMSFVESQITFAPHGHESVVEVDGRKIIKHEHYPGMPLDMAHELYHKIKDLMERTEPVTIEVPEEKPDLPVIHMSSEDRARQKQSGGEE